MENFSVLMSVYKNEKAEYLELAIDSILKQTIVPNEIVIVKDGTLTHELEMILDKFSTKYEFFKFLEFKENRGLGLALRDGVLSCSNELIARMDTDLFYLLFIFFRKRINKYQYAAAFLFIIIISCILGSNSLGSYIFRIFDDGFWAHKLGKWLSMSSREYEHRFNILGLLANSFFIVIFYILINFMGRYIINSIPYDKEHINMDKNDETYFRRITLYKNTSFCLLFTIPAYIVSTEYQRLLYGTLLIYYSLWGEFIYRKIKIENDNRLSYCFITFITIILMISFYIYSTPSHDVFATLYDNMLFR